MDEKITLNLKVEKGLFAFGDGLVKYEAYISLENKMLLLYDYARTLYNALSGFVVEGKDIVDAYVTAEYTLILGIVQLCTNLSVEGDNPIEINDLIGSGLWNIIRTRIKNYDDLRKDIDSIEKLMFEKIKYDNMTNVKLNNIFDKISSVLDNFSNFNVDEFSKKMGEFQEELKKLNETVPGITSSQVSPKRKTKKESDLN